MVRAIETFYSGYRFRSRLEARWAVLFDALGVAWLYEPEGFVLDSGVMYLPDFFIPEWGCFAEVKPMWFSTEEYSKCARLEKPCILLDVPAPIIARGYHVTGYEDFTGNYWKENPMSADGRVLLQMSARKHRLWFMFGEHVGNYPADETPEIAAKSARFEFGESGT